MYPLVNEMSWADESASEVTPVLRRQEPFVRLLGDDETRNQFSLVFRPSNNTNVSSWRYALPPASISPAFRKVLNVFQFPVARLKRAGTLRFLYEASSCPSV